MTARPHAEAAQPPTPDLIRRRRLLGFGAGAASIVALQPLPLLAADDVAALLRSGGVAIALRHALAPGTFDPPDFRLGACSTQRNLSDEGRAQARRIGAWFSERSLKPARVRSGPWCRCIDTAALAFGTVAQVEPWRALGSPRGSPETTNDEHLKQLREGLAALAAQRAGRFEAWVSHMFVLQALAGANTASGEGLVLRVRDGGAAKVQVLGRLAIG